ncbi:MAG: hypothetical protein HY898_29375 [Deltaproteobacteria bacterium]|nr:hypothetical protein [Deltaproteobacteria bacterium]
MTALLLAFDKMVDALMVDFDSDEDKRALGALIARWAEEKDPFRAWSDEVLVPWHYIRFQTYAHHRAIGLARRLDAHSTVRRLERSPHPGLVDDILWHGDEAQPSLRSLEELLAKAPPVLDAAGAWVPERHVVAVAALGQIVKRIDRFDRHLIAEIIVAPEDRARVEAVEAVRNWRGNLLPASLDSLFHALLGRPDGTQLATAYLGFVAGRLLRDGSVSRGFPDAQDEDLRWSSTRAAFDALIGTMRATRADVAISDIEAAWKRAEDQAHGRHERELERPVVGRPRRGIPNWIGDAARELSGDGMPYLFAAVLLSAEDEGTARGGSAMMAKLWMWAEELFVKRDPSLSAVLQRLPFSECDKALGKLVARLDDPFDTIQRTYLKLEPIRRRSRFAFRYDDTRGDVESILLLRVGLCACELGMRSGADDARAARCHQMFDWIFERSRQLWLTAVLDVSNMAEQLVVVCFAHVHAVFPADLKHRLPGMLASIGTTPEMVLRAAELLLRNGVEPDLVADCAGSAGLDLADTVRDACRLVELGLLQVESCGSLRPVASALGLPVPPSFKDESDVRLVK